MSTMRKVLICILTVCMALCAGLALAACNNVYPDFKNPADVGIGSGPEDPDNRYTIKVQSESGLALNGVQVNLKKNGATVVSGLSKSGEITLYAEPDDYALEVDEKTLPEGFKAPAETVTTGEQRDLTVKLPSGVMSSTASSSTRYRIGNVMHDFVVTRYYDENGEVKSREYKLSELVAGYNCVVINFFFTSCGPCNYEFPYMERAYKKYSGEVALIALADPSRDSATVVKNFAKRGDGENPYTFPMAVDTAGLHGFFQVTQWPTTIVIDKYGIYVYRESGANISESSWTALFERYSSGDYTVDPANPGNPGGPADNKKPTGVTESDYSLMPAQIAPNATDKVVKFETETNEKDAEYNWPWIIGNDSDYTYLTASNSGQDPSFSMIYVELNLAFGDMVSFDYQLRSNGNYDQFIVIVSEEGRADSRVPLLQVGGESREWITASNIYTAGAAGRYTFAFVYSKAYDSGKIPIENDYARIKNVSVTNVTDTDKAIDVARSIYHEGLKPENIVLGSDGLYHLQGMKNPEYNGALVWIDLWNRTPWSIEHTKSYGFNVQGESGSYDPSMYYLSYWLFSNYKTKDETEPLKYDYLTADEGEYLDIILDVQRFSDSRYVPVNETLKDILVKFLEKFNSERLGGEIAKTFNESSECEASDWIQMCYFFLHYNSDNFKHIEKVTDGDGAVREVESLCFVHGDPTEGMLYMNAYVAQINEEGDNSFPNHVNITKTNSGNGGGGIYFKFTVPKSGVYLFDTQYKPEDEADPELNLYRQKLLANGEYAKFPVYFHHIADDRSYDALERSITDIGELSNAFGYVYLEEGDIIYVQCRQFMAGVAGKYDLSVKYIAESYDWLCLAGEGLGLFNGVINENGDIIGAVYAAINVAYDEEEGCFRHMLPNGDFGSIVYIDFVHANNYDEEMHSLEDMLTIKLKDDDYYYFDLRGLGQLNHLETMRNYIEKSKEGKDESDPLYGLLKADMQLVQTISEILQWRSGNGDGYDTGYWLSVACYYQHIGASANN